MLFRRTCALGLITAIALSGHALAQSTSADETQAPSEKTATETADLPLGQPEQPRRRIFIEEVFGDWEQRCVRIDGQQSGCQLFQVLKDDVGNSVAEFTLAPLAAPEGEAVAGGTIITPLETLLTGQLRLTIDNGETKVYPFRFCQQVGCYVRLGFTADDIAAFKRGSVARVSIIPLAAPDEVVTLEASLNGFTAGYDALAAPADN